MSYIVVLLAATTTGLITNTRSSFEELKDEIKLASIDDNLIQQSSNIKSTPAFLTIETGLKDCPPGYFTDNYYASDIDGVPLIPDCLLCFNGNYCTGDSNLCPCPPGTYNPDYGSSDISSCLVCPSGNYCLLGSMFSIPCPAGTFNPIEGSSDGFDCLTCPPGFYCPEGSSNPFMCFLGTFNPNYGSMDMSSCITCDPGYFCPEGSTNEVRCPDDYDNYEANGLASIDECYISQFIYQEGS